MNSIQKRLAFGLKTDLQHMAVQAGRINNLDSDEEALRAVEVEIQHLEELAEKWKSIVKSIRGEPREKMLPVPVEIIRWQNGMVMVFGTDGEQIPEYQGPYEEAMKVIPEKYHHLLVERTWPSY